MKQKYTVTIAGMTVNLVSDESEEYVGGLVRLLDQRINEMIVSSKHCGKSEAILFCAIDYFDDKIKSSLKFQRMQETIDSLTAENAELRARLGIIDAPKPEDGISLPDCSVSEESGDTAKKEKAGRR